MTDWLRVLATLRDRDARCVVVTIAAVKGSVPREAGTKMIVADDAVTGTIGGGHLEYKAIEMARAMLSDDAVPRRAQRFPLGASLGQCCGGVATLLLETIAPARDAWVAALIAHDLAATPCVTVSVADGAVAGKLVVDNERVVGGLDDAALNATAAAAARGMLAGAETAPRLFVAADAVARGIAAPLLLLEPVRPRDFRIVVFGAGHVGRALVAALSRLHAHIDWVDSRAEEFPAHLPDNVDVEVTDTPECVIDDARGGSYFLVLTHSHDLDYVLTERILRRGDFVYLGLIGSKTKHNTFERRLTQRGVSEALRERVTCPIGIPGITGKEPAEIAIAVAAELLLLRATTASAALRSPRSALRRA
ncbi:MAG: xanthine dehydrogenase accessory protein XdhC [Casimicrobiaceae bacterium]